MLPPTAIIPIRPQLLEPEEVNTDWLGCKNISLFVWRLDTLHHEVAGNKWLKLSGWIDQMLDAKKSGIMTAGGPWSNHLHAAAAYCRLQQWPFHAIVKGKENEWTPMLRDIAQGGGRITWTNRSEFYQNQKCMDLANKSGMQWVPMGADGETGAMGVTQYCNRLPSLKFDEIWCAAGTGTTIEGIYHSHLSAATMVAFMPGFRDPALIKKMDHLASNGKRRLLLRQLPKDKFGKYTHEQINTMNEWHQHTGIGTDIVYTGKLLQLLQETLSEKTFQHPTKILWVHTGGLQGNRSLPAGMLHYAPQP